MNTALSLTGVPVASLDAGIWPVGVMDLDVE